MNPLNKTALKNFAVAARRELIERVELQALKTGITKEKVTEATLESSDAVIIHGKPLSDLERRQRNQLINRINDKGYEQVIDEVAYTWFNRFVALRFMEVNDYLPTRVRVLSSEDPSNTEPDMIKEALSLDLDIDKEKIYDLKTNNKTDELFKYLIRLHCNDLNKYMPFMFETLEDYTMILFPEGLLGTESFVRDMTNTEMIPEENWEEVEIVGWLYQFYIADEKDRVFKEKKKYQSSDIPFATQLFTPKWIVKYMVQNSLGKYWVESHPEDEQLINNWEFYIKNTDEQYEEVKKELINSELNVEEITCFDPAMGSGHILVYMFEVLYEIYTERGYMSREIPKLIIENNLYGLDIDERAYQLAGFSIIMKALEYNRRFLRTIAREGLTLNLASIEESNLITERHVEYLKLNDEELAKQYINQFKDAKSIGSLLKLTHIDTSNIENKMDELISTPVKDLFDEEVHYQILAYLPKLLKQTKIMDSKYDIIVTNPPYMGRRSMNKELTTYLDKHYPDSKADLFAAFMELKQYTRKNGFYSMINQHSWMFLSSYEKLREKVIDHKHIDTMLHLGTRAFEEIGGEVVQTTAFVLRNEVNRKANGVYIRLVDYNNAKEKPIKTIEAVQNPKVSYCYTFDQEKFSKIPGSPISYWLSDRYTNVFEKASTLNELADCRTGMQTGNNDKYIRNWFEVLYKESSIYSKGGKWKKYNCGGENRKWYGNHNNLVLWGNNGESIKAEKGSVIRNENYYYRQGISWKRIGSSGMFLRFMPAGFIFDQSGDSMFLKQEKYLKYILAFVNSKVAMKSFEVFAPTLNLTAGNMNKLPIIIDEAKLKLIEGLVGENISVSKRDWDSFELSWEFRKHPLLEYSSDRIDESFVQFQTILEEQFIQLKANEEGLNQIFIEIYNLGDELKSEVEEKDITIRKADLERDIKSFISYAVGCALGRYSLDEDGLIFAGGKFDASSYETFPADEDNILLISSEPYFKGDIVSLFINFVETTYGSETLEENLLFVADAIGKRNNETAREGIRRYFLNNFYKDHVQTYKKHPIYWLFTSGKEKAFNCLIYMHRYDESTLSCMRTDYLHDVQARYETEKSDLQYVIESDASTTEIRHAKKELTSVEKKIAELKAYDEKLHHMADMQIEIDLDDGVKVNYKKFEGLVAKI